MGCISGGERAWGKKGSLWNGWHFGVDVDVHFREATASVLVNNGDLDLKLVLL